MKRWCSVVALAGVLAVGLVPSVAGAQSPAPEGGSQDAASDRAMSFSARGGECRDTVPGGIVLASGYAVVLAFLGLFVARLAGENRKLEASIASLESRLARAAERGGTAG